MLYQTLCLITVLFSLQSSGRFKQFKCTYTRLQTSQVGKCTQSHSKLKTTLLSLTAYQFGIVSDNMLRKKTVVDTSDTLTESYRPSESSGHSKSSEDRNLVSECTERRSDSNAAL